MKAVKKISILLLALVITISFITGCSSKKASMAANVPTSNTMNNIPKNDGLHISGKVTKVKGKKITISVMPGGGMQDGPGGGPGGNQSGTAPSGMPSQKQQDQNVQQPSQGDNKKGGKVLKMKTKVITISDESKISIQNGNATSSGNLKDIKKDSFLNITYTKNKSGKKVLSSIVVLTMQQPGNKINPPINSSNNN